MTQVTRALGMRDAHCAVDQMAHLLGTLASRDELAGDVLEQVLQVDFLLIAAPSAERACWPTIATTGTWSIFASYSPLSR